MAKEGTVKKMKLTAIKAEKDKPYPRLEPDEWYKGVFEEADAKDGQYGPYVILKFKVLKGTLETGEEITEPLSTSAMMNLSLTPSSQLWKFIKVFIGEEPELDQDYDLTAYYGTKYRLLIKDRKPKKGQDDNTKFQYVDTIKRIKKRTKAS